MFPQVPFGFQQKPIHFANGSIIQGIVDTTGNIVKVVFGVGGVVHRNTDVFGNGRIINLFIASGSISHGNTDVDGSLFLNVKLINGSVTLASTDVDGTATKSLPYNDNFAARLTLVGVPVTTTANNQLATGEVGESILNGTIESLWWEWTAPYTGTFNINTQGSNFDTFLGIYTGSGTSVSTLTLIAQDDDSGGAGTSRIVISFTQNITYYIRVEGYSSNKGNIVLGIIAV